MLTYKYIYGPVNSWRLGRSLGIDPISSKKKVCTFDCVYCQIGKSESCPPKRRVFVPTRKLIKELSSMPELKVDYITFSGTGEPTLAKNLKEIITAVRSLRKEKIAVLTNATLLGRKDVQRELKGVDLIEAKLDASSDKLLQIINNPHKSISVKKIIESIKMFKKGFKGELALQVMFTKDNIAYSENIAKIVKIIKPDEVHLNTPTRPCGVKPVSKKEIDKVRPYLRGFKILSVYDRIKRKKTRPISRQETLRRRGKI